MKNQKGFIVPLLLTIIAILVIGGGVYVYQNKVTENTKVGNDTVKVTEETSSTGAVTTTNVDMTLAKKTYTESSGAYSFKYPERLMATEAPFIPEVPESRVYLEDADGNRIANIYALYEKMQNLPQKNGDGFEIITINNHTAWRVYLPGHPEYGNKYILTAEDANPSRFLILEMPEASSIMPQQEIDAILNSASINETKIEVLLNKKPVAPVRRTTN